MLAGSVRVAQSGADVAAAEWAVGAPVAVVGGLRCAVHDARQGKGLADDACHIVLRMLDIRFWS